MIRSVISIFLVVSMTFALTAYLGSFKIRKYQVRKEMKNLIKTGAPDSLHHYFYLDEIESDPSKITWIHSKEFRYRGDMYDILSKADDNGRLLLHCIKDVKESGLFAELDRMVNLYMNGDPQHKNQQLQWQKLFHSLYKVSDDHNVRLICAESIGHHTPYSLEMITRNAPPLTPPPRQMV